MPAKLNGGHAETNVDFFNRPASAQLPWPWRPAPSGADIAVGHRPGVSIERKRHVREGNAYRLASSLAIAGVVVVAVASRFHGGAEPQNLLSVSGVSILNPQYVGVAAQQ